MTLSGLVEIEAMTADPYSGPDESDINVATAQVGLEAQVNEWVNANLVLLWEEEDGASNELTVDEATITVGNTEVSPFYFTAGRMVVPFGSFETHMISDPMTLDIGETYETVALVGFKAENGIYSMAHVFNGDMDENGDSTLDNGGLKFGYAMALEESALDAGVSYISDLADSDGISDTLDSDFGTAGSINEEIAGFGLHMVGNYGPFKVIGEYVSATDAFDPATEFAFNGSGAEPSAWNLEAGYTFEKGIAGKETGIAAGYQQTEEAIDLGLPEDRISLGMSIAMMENTTLKFEWMHDSDYASTDVGNATVGNAGTGDSGDTLTGQLAVEF